MIEPYGLDAITAFERLPFLKVGAFAGGQSSFDRAGANNDFNLFLGVDAAGDHIMLDVKGAGIVYRLWFTGYDASAYLKVYVDGVLTQHCTLQDLFERHICGGFAPPLVDRRSGGSYCYLPIPFSESIRLTTNGTPLPGLGFFYNIGYHRYAVGAPIARWTGSEDVAPAQALWRRAETGADPRPERERTLVAERVDLAPQGAASILDLPGPRSISSLKLHLGAAEADVLNNVWLRVWWDERPDAAIDAPLSVFFARGRFTGAARPKSLGIGILDDNWLYSYFPMPFARRAQVALANGLGSTVEIHYRIEHEPFTDDLSRVGYFTTSYRQQAGVTDKSLLLLDVEGSGHLVGIAASIESPQNEPAYLFLEGDERIYVDEGRTPAIHGTGMEDFFNAGWYFETVPFSAPLHGCNLKESRDGREFLSTYRFLLQDAVPFRKHLRVTLEHGRTNEVPVEACTLAYFYYQPFVRAFCHDVLDVNNPASERAHHYAISGQQWEGSRTWTFEGDFDRPENRVEEDGRAHRGVSEFTITMPRDNQGVVLRRMFDQSITNQQAVVFVDGARVGLWAKTGGNEHPTTDHKWCEDDFIIPPALSEGRTSLRIRLEFVPTDVRSNERSLDWNEFKYSAYALHDTGDCRPSLVSPRLPPASMVGAASRSRDKLEVIVGDHAAALIPAAWEPRAPTWYTWWPIGRVTLQPGAPVHVVSRSKDRLDAFFTNADRQPCTAAWSADDPRWRALTVAERLRPGSGGETPTVPPAAPITAICRSADHLDIFVVGSDGRVYSAAWPNDDPAHQPEGSHWIGWWSLPDVQGDAGSPVYGASCAPDKIDVFVTNAHGEVYTAAWEPSLQWRGSRLRDRLAAGSLVPDLEPGSPVTTVSRRRDHLDIFVVGKDGGVYTAAWQPGARFWKGWWKLPTIRAQQGTRVGVVSRAVDRLDVFTTDPAGEMYTASWAPGSLWQGWMLKDRLDPASAFTPKVASGSPITAVSRNTDHIDIFVVGEDTRVWTAAWEPGFGGPWRGWRPLGH